jgi:hypothetical protein
MKNIHLIPTHKPGRLVQIKDNLFFTTTTEIPGGVFKHIYITNDDKIKEGDWIMLDNSIKELPEYQGLHVIQIVDNTSLKSAIALNCKKIILTTDVDLIKDGVQAIDDEFLQWYVKNPSCEEVEVSSLGVCNKDTGECGHYKWEYDLPQEEPKQETLEEAAEKYAENEIKDRGTYKDKLICSIDFMAGAQCQAERMYSEEEVMHIVSEALQSVLVTVDLEQWFKQFKKK